MSRELGKLLIGSFVDKVGGKLVVEWDKALAHYFMDTLTDPIEARGGLHGN